MNVEDLKDPGVLLRATVWDMISAMAERGTTHIRVLGSIGDAEFLVTLSLGSTGELSKLDASIGKLTKKADEKQSPSRDTTAASVADHSQDETKGGND